MGGPTALSSSPGVCCLIGSGGPRPVAPSHPLPQALVDHVTCSCSLTPLSLPLQGPCGSQDTTQSILWLPATLHPALAVLRGSGLLACWLGPSQPSACGVPTLAGWLSCWRAAPLASAVATLGCSWRAAGGSGASRSLHSQVAGEPSSCAAATGAGRRASSSPCFPF